METIKNIEVKATARVYGSMQYRSNGVYIEVVLECEVHAQGVQLSNTSYTWDIEVNAGMEVDKEIQRAALYYAQLKPLLVFFNKEQIIKYVTSYLKKQLK